jgi:RND family efflux transporter MFP subunit
MKLHFLKSKIFIAFAMLGLIAVSCDKKENKHVSVSQEKVAAQVAVANLKEYPIIHRFSGKLEADKQSNLSTRIMGQISNVYVKPGQKVKKDQLLIQIRNQDILAKKAQVEASKVEVTTAYESAEKDMKRYEALHKSKSASDKEMEDMNTRYKMAKAQLDAVEQMEKEVDENMRYASICAPYSGVITSRFVQEGDLANPGMPLLSIESPAQWKVIARIPEADIAKVNLNDKLQVNFKAIGKDFDGQIIEINPSTTNTGNQYEAKILISIPKDCTAKLYSGMYASVLFEHGAQELILIPKKSLVHRGQLVGLYAVSQSGNALLRWVKTGKVYGENIEILSGLNNGEKYVETSDSKLTDGALVSAK